MPLTIGLSAPPCEKATVILPLKLAVAVNSPYRVSFSYDLTGHDSVSLDDGYRRYLLPGNQRQISIPFRWPSFYQVKLVKGNQTVSPVLGIHQKTRGWETFVKGLPALERTPSGGKAYLSPASVRTLGIPDQDYWVEYRNIRDFSIRADEAGYEVRFRNDPAEGGVPCFDFNFEVISEHHKIAVALLGTGCTGLRG